MSIDLDQGVPIPDATLQTRVLAPLRLSSDSQPICKACGFSAVLN